MPDYILQEYGSKILDNKIKLMKYKIKTPRETYELEANNKDEVRKSICEKENITIEKAHEESYDQSIYHQLNPRYKGWTLGKSKTSMQLYGCALMCWSYVARKDPKEVDKLFIEKGVYNVDMIDFKKASEVLGFKDYEKSTDINRMPSQEETIKEVALGRGQHFVVRINKDSKRTIFDPWQNAILPINYYPFVSYRIFDR